MASIPPLQPSEIPNVNLEKISGGQPGFINISRHMCVGDQVGEENTLKNIGEFQYACGYYHPDIRKSYANNVSLNGTDFVLYDTVSGQGCSDCSSGAIQPNGLIGGNGTFVDYVERSTNLNRTMHFVNRFAMIPNAKLNSQTSTFKARASLIFKHPRMQLDELKYFGVPFEKRSEVVSVSSNEVITITNWNIQAGQCGTLSVVFFKKDLSQIAIADKNLGNIHTFKILNSNLTQHKETPLSHYTFAVTWNNNGGNKGDEPGSCNNIKLRIPQAPFWDDDTVMVIFLGGNGDDGRKTQNFDCRSIDYVTTPTSSFTWFNGPLRPANFRTNFSRTHLNEKLSYTIDKYTDTFFGCSQTRDIDFQLNPNGTKQGSDQLWTVPESGSHIMKLVSQDYYERECSDRISGIITNEQDAVIYTANCKENVGDPMTPVTVEDTDKPRTGEESIPGKHNIEKCMSYSMNVNPVDKRINQSRCCSPKISGPFKLESNKRGLNERIYDVPYAKDNPFGSKPDLSLFHDNFRYQLKYRMDCECDGSNCEPGVCTGCTSSNKEEYNACLATDKCKNNNCCSDPCVTEEGAFCPAVYEECIRSLNCVARGCCEECNTCIIETTDEYDQCLAGTGKFAGTNCNARGCCKVPCGLCPESYTECLASPACVASGCCKVDCEDCVSDTLLEYFSCTRNENIFGVTKYKNTFESFCCLNTCCETDCDSFEDLSYNECVSNINCNEAKCYLSKANPNYSPNRNITSNTITWGAGGDVDGNGSGVATNSDSGSTGGVYKGIIMKTPGGQNFAPLLPNYSPCCGGTPWCTGSCKPLMLRGSDVTDQELINIFGIPSSNVSDVKNAVSGSTVSIIGSGAVDQEWEHFHFKWNTTTGVTNNVSLVKILDQSYTDGGRQGFSNNYNFTIPSVESKEVLVIAVYDGTGSHNVSMSLNLTCSSACPTNTVDQYITCLQNSACHNLSSTTNNCCNFPCGDNTSPSNTCYKQLFVQRNFGGELRFPETHEECLTISECSVNGCCDFFFPRKCTL